MSANNAQEPNKNELTSSVETALAKIATAYIKASARIAPTYPEITVQNLMM